MRGRETTVENSTDRQKIDEVCFFFGLFLETVSKLLTLCLFSRNWNRGGDDDLMPSTKFLPHFLDATNGRVAQLITDVSDIFSERLPELFTTEEPFPWAEECLRYDDSDALAACKMGREWAKEWLDVTRRYWRMLPEVMRRANRRSTVQFRVSFSDDRRGWDEEIGCHHGDDILDLLKDVEKGRRESLGKSYGGRGVDSGRLDCKVPTRSVFIFFFLIILTRCI